MQIRLFRFKYNDPKIVASEKVQFRRAPIRSLFFFKISYLFFNTIGKSRISDLFEPLKAEIIIILISFFKSRIWAGFYFIILRSHPTHILLPTKVETIRAPLKIKTTTSLIISRYNIRTYNIIIIINIINYYIYQTVDVHNAHTPISETTANAAHTVLTNRSGQTKRQTQRRIVVVVVWVTSGYHSNLWIQLNLITSDIPISSLPWCS